MTDPFSTRGYRMFKFNPTEKVRAWPIFAKDATVLINRSQGSHYTLKQIKDNIIVHSYFLANYQRIMSAYNTTGAPYEDEFFEGYNEMVALSPEALQKKYTLLLKRWNERVAVKAKKIENKKLKKQSLANIYASEDAIAPKKLAADLSAYAKLNVTEKRNLAKKHASEKDAYFKKHGGALVGSDIIGASIRGAALVGASIRGAALIGGIRATTRTPKAKRVKKVKRKTKWTTFLKMKKAEHPDLSLTAVASMYGKKGSKHSEYINYVPKKNDD